MIRSLDDSDKIWDVAIIGGGATGLGAAIESVTRGYKTVLLEQHDFAKGTSSRSTKLIHGGVRYLAQGNISLVIDALRERGLLKRNAPHLVTDLAFVIPGFKWWAVPSYVIGLTLYDLLAGKWGIGRSLPLSKNRTLLSIPGLISRSLKGGIKYHDCQFDDARLAINLCQTFCEQGGVAINYMKVTGLQKKDGKINGVVAENREKGLSCSIAAKCVINATGVFVDHILKMDTPESKDVVKPSQGIHLVLDRKFLPGRDALMIPKTEDGRVFFAVPWHDRVILGTTDVEKEEVEVEPRAQDEEVEFILRTARYYFSTPPQRSDVRSVFAGLRPLAAPVSPGKKTKEISRGHRIMVSGSGLVTIIGGKWTTYRKMGEDVINQAASVAGLPSHKSVTRNLKIHGYTEGADPEHSRYWYGSDEPLVQQLMTELTGMEEYLSESLSILKVQIVWSVRFEMARTIEDFLSRRTRALQLDAAESIRIAPVVAEIMAAELGFDQHWEKDQVMAFNDLADGYQLREWDHS